MLKTKQKKTVAANTTSTTVVDLSKIDNFLAKVSIVASILVKQSPVHANVPDECVARAGECRHHPDIEESAAGTAHIFI